jgi:hypothetical protein
MKVLELLNSPAVKNLLFLSIFLKQLPVQKISPQLQFCKAHQVIDN